jgi:hypothetical protein
MITMHGASMVLAACCSLISIAPAPQQAAQSSVSPFEEVRGFEGLVARAIQNTNGASGTVRGSGSPLEPGVYVAVGVNALGIFDQILPVIEAGHPREAAMAKECQAACPLSFYRAFTTAFRRLNGETKEIGVDFPPRLLFAGAPDTLAATVIASIYTAMQTWPRVAPPHVFLVLQDPSGHLVEKPVSVLPPGGVDVLAGTPVLGLRITASSGGRFTFSAADPRFGPKREAQGMQEARLALDKIKKEYPNKNAIIVQASEELPYLEYIAAIEMVTPTFPKIIIGRPDVPFAMNP